MSQIIHLHLGTTTITTINIIISVPQFTETIWFTVWFPIGQTGNSCTKLLTIYSKNDLICGQTSAHSSVLRGFHLLVVNIVEAHLFLRRIFFNVFSAANQILTSHRSSVQRALVISALIIVRWLHFAQRLTFVCKCTV